MKEILNFVIPAGVLETDFAITSRNIEYVYRSSFMSVVKEMSKSLLSIITLKLTYLTLVFDALSKHTVPVYAAFALCSWVSSPSVLPHDFLLIVFFCSHIAGRQQFSSMFYRGGTFL